MNQEDGVDDSISNQTKTNNKQSTKQIIDQNPKMKKWLYFYKRGK